MQVTEAGENSEARGGADQLPPTSRYSFGPKQFDSLFAAVYRGKDNRTGKPVSLHLFTIPVGATDLAQVADAVKPVQASNKASIARPIEVVSEGGRNLLVTDFIEGHTVRQLLKRKKDTGATGFSPRGTRNIVTQLIKALEACETPHGALSLDSVTIDKSGHLTLADFGLWPLLQKSEAAPLAASIAPEVASGTPPTARSDVFGIGSLLYEILMGQPAKPGCPRPSTALGLAAGVDSILNACTQDSADKRPTDLARLRGVISDALVGEKAKGKTVKRKAPTESLAQKIGQGMAPQATRADSNEERWLLSRNKLDYGPYTTAGLLEQIAEGQAQPGNFVSDSFTGEKTPIESHPLFEEAVSKAAENRVAKERANAEVVHVAREKRRDRALYGTILAGVVGLGLAGFGVFTVLRTDTGESDSAISLDDDSFDITIGPSKNVAERRGRRNPNNRGKRTDRRSIKSPPPVGANTEAWDSAVDLGDVSQGGGEERLTDAQVNRALQGQGQKLARCMANSPVSQATVRFIVRGSGTVSYVGVNGSTSSPLAKCVRGAVQKVSFPSFDGVRDRRTFSISK